MVYGKVYKKCYFAHFRKCWLSLTLEVDRNAASFLEKSPSPKDDYRNVEDGSQTCQIYDATKSVLAVECCTRQHISCSSCF